MDKIHPDLRVIHLDFFPSELLVTLRLEIF